MSQVSDEKQPAKTIGETAIELGFLTEAQLAEVLEVQKKLAELGVPEDLPSILRKRHLLNEDQLKSCQKAVEKKNIAGFEILARVGHGAFGAVYKARQLSMDRIVALKILPKDLAQDPTFKERFFREARASGRLDHMNIVHGIDVGEARGVTYFAMEYVDGPTVKQMLKRRGKFDWPEAVRITIQVANALAYAWRQNLIHRDIKPDNVMITSDGTAKLCDLGLAKQLKAAEESDLTNAGQAVGTPHYISPEQAKGKRDIDTRSDIYSLGASLYHMLTGRVPFPDSSGTAVMVMHVTDQAASPKEVAPEIPDDLELVLAKSMAKAKEDRHQEPADFAEDLALVLEGEPPYFAAGFHAKSSIFYKPSRMPPNHEPLADHERRISPTGRFARISGRLPRSTTGPLPVIGPRLDKTGPHSAVGREGDVGRSTTRSAEPIRPRDDDHAKVQAEPDPEANRATAKFAEPIVMRGRKTDKLEPIRGLPDFEPSTAEPPGPAANPQERPAAKGASKAHVSRQGPAPAPPSKAPSGVVVWWFLGMLSLGGGIYFGFHLPIHGEAAQLPADGQKPSAPPGPAKVVQTTAEKSESGAQPPGVLVTPEGQAHPAAVNPGLPKPPKRITQPLPPEAAPPEHVTARPAGVTKEPEPVVAPEPDLEAAALQAFDKASQLFKQRKLAAIRPVLDEIQQKYTRTAWYTAHRALVDCAYFRLEAQAKPWGDLFAAPAQPLDGPAKDRWELLYDQLTFEPNEQQEWQLLPGTKVNWKVGALTVTPSGPGPAGIVLGVPFMQAERLEAFFEPAAGVEYGWAIYADLHESEPLATCWYAVDGSIHFWANEVEKTLALRVPLEPAGAEARPAVRRVLAQFKPRKAWVDVNGKKEELDLPPSPTGRMIPALVVNKGAAKVGRIFLSGSFDPGLGKLLLEAADRAKRLKAAVAKGGMHKLKITVASEHPCGVWVGDKRASPDTQAGYAPATYMFTVPVGSSIAVKQFMPAGKSGGPVLIDIGPQAGAGKHTGTGLNPHVWAASGELGNWMHDPTTRAGWHPVSDKLVAEEIQNKVPPGAQARFVLAANKSVLLRYIFDPEDMK